MITGDHPATAAAIAVELGIVPGGARAVAGAELDGDGRGRALARAVREVSVYARVSPEHKLRIVEALQRQGEIVAMTGDGVNDAPALKRADIGVAMGDHGDRRVEGGGRHDPRGRQLRLDRGRGGGRPGDLRQHPASSSASCSRRTSGEVMTMFFGVVFAGAIGLRASRASRSRCRCSPPDPVDEPADRLGPGPRAGRGRGRPADVMRRPPRDPRRPRDHAGHVARHPRPSAR